MILSHHQEVDKQSPKNHGRFIGSSAETLSVVSSGVVWLFGFLPRRGMGFPFSSTAGRGNLEVRGITISPMRGLPRCRRGFPSSSTVGLTGFGDFFTPARGFIPGAGRSSSVFVSDLPISLLRGLPLYLIGMPNSSKVERGSLGT